MQATITSTGQITLPRILCERLRLVAGDRVEFILEDDNVVRMLPKTAPVTRLKGMLPRPTRPVSLDEMAEAIAVGSQGIDS